MFRCEEELTREKICELGDVEKENIPWVTIFFQIDEDQFAVFLQISDKCDSITKKNPIQ